MSGFNRQSAASDRPARPAPAAARLRVGRGVLPWGALALLVLAAPSCSARTSTTDDTHLLVIAIDRTGSIAQADTRQAEVTPQTQTILETAFSDGVDLVELIGLGSNHDQVATIARADLTAIEGNTESKRNETRQRLIDDLASAAGQVAAEPIDTHGTDVFAALNQAAALCQAPEVTECSVVFLSDMEDQRVTALASPDDAVDELAHLMPNLSGITVEISGLGASGADAETVHQVQATWELLLAGAGAVDVRIARAL